MPQRHGYPLGEGYINKMHPLDIKELRHHQAFQLGQNNLKLTKNQLRWEYEKFIILPGIQTL